jgi:hypoxanthine-DNA glycosylase
VKSSLQNSSTPPTHCAAPSRRWSAATSLRRGEYYAKAQNRFWWIMGQIFGAGPDLPYAARCTRLTLHGIALWDVCAAAERLGSLDSAIVTASVVPNDFATFLQNHSAIRRIAFNGRKAEQLFVRHVLRASPQELAALPRVTLPSTSPAHAGIAANAKLASWREGLG